MSQIAVVTGASSGIGAGIVRTLAAAGIEVHALARRPDRLAALSAETGCTTHMVDVTDTVRLAEVMGSLQPDILVCNAGRGAGFEGLASTSHDTLAATIEINVTALLDTIRLALPGMIERGRGHVVTMGSVSGLYPSVSSIYGGAKGAVTLIGQDLRLELRGTGIRVTDIRPGRVTSEFYDVAVDDPDLRVRTKATGIRELVPEDIARAVLYAVTAPSHVNVSAIEIQPIEQTYGGTQFDPG
ncbi:MAG: SDR family oxidoreductase [Pseudomonadota bacterium]